VGRVEVGVEQADGHAFDVVGHCVEAVQRNRRELDPRRVQPTTDLEAQPPRYERSGAVDERVVQRRAVLTADLDDVGEAVGRDERDAPTSTFEDRVGGDGRPVRERGHLDAER
jgi:hypothetical protein